jgi:hypothetical protein
MCIVQHWFWLLGQKRKNGRSKYFVGLSSLLVELGSLGWDFHLFILFPAVYVLILSYLHVLSYFISFKFEIPHVID